MPAYKYKCTECKDEIILTLPISTDPKLTFECRTWYGDRNSGFSCMGDLKRGIIAHGTRYVKTKDRLGDWYKNKTGEELMGG